MRIKHIILASAVLVSVSSFAQKDELKKLKKIYEKDEIKGNDLLEYKNLVSKVEPLSTEESDKIYAGFYKAMIPVLESLAIDKTMSPVQIQSALMKLANPTSIADLAKGLNATLDFEKKSGKKIYTDDINETITSFKPELVNLAIGLGNAQKYEEACDVLYAIYQLDKKDQEKLFYAASYAVNALNYDKAYDYYNQLKVLNYTGEGTVYWATNKATKKEETFNNKNERDIFLKAGTHEKPRDEKLESKRGEIFKNIALIFIQKGKTEEAKAAIVEAKNANPQDKSLLLTEANLYLELNDNEKYTQLVSEIIKNDPNNVDLVYNLGVTNANLNRIEEAVSYYKKALELDPNYFDALLNLSELKLRNDEKYVNEMNKLGTSEKDNKRYESLKVERAKNFNSILPYLEKAVELKPDNESAKKTLLSVYNALEMTDKYKALKAKI
jgi:tetratricopeptide (TPR) repeat protein